MTSLAVNPLHGFCNLIHKFQLFNTTNYNFQDCFDQEIDPSLNFKLCIKRPSFHSSVSMILLQ